MTRDFKTCSVLWLLFVITVLPLQAQHTVSGKVIDSETKLPLEMATVTLTQGTGPLPFGYALTDQEGRFSFSLPTDEVGPWQVHAAYLGYQKESQEAMPDKEMIFRLTPQAIAIKEVEIKGGRIYGRQDTIRYDLARFASAKDQNIKETLKKLPGIDINEQTGEIRYNGKAISQFTVEGMDVTGGRYNQITDNLKSDAVESAEVIEHFQPIRSLRQRIPTDNVALNLQLKPEIRSRWLLTIQADGGFGDKGLYGGKLNALQLARKRQGVYTYQTDNTGKDLQAGLNQLTSNMQAFITETAAPRLISQPVLSFPLEKKRLSDHQIQLVSVNRLHQKGEEQQVRMTLNYTYADQRRNQGTDETYFYPNDTIRTSRQQDYHLLAHRLNATCYYEKNSEQTFTRNQLEVNGSWERSIERLQGDQQVNQLKQTANMDIINRLNALRNSEHSTTGFHSYLRYSYVPSQLAFAQTDQSLDIQQVYTDNQLSYQWKKNAWTSGITGGLQGELTYLKQQSVFKNHQFQLYATPLLRWEQGKWRIVLSADAVYLRKPYQKYTDWRINPSLFLRYQLNVRWEMTASVRYEKKHKETESFYPNAYWQDYRTLILYSGKVPETRHQTYTFYLSYKRPIKEFFWSLSGSYWSEKSNLMTHIEYQDQLFRQTSWHVPNRSRTYTFSSLASKGCYAWNLKTSIETQFLHSEGKQAGQGSIQPFQYNQLAFIPKITWAPFAWAEATYQANIACSRSVVGETNSLSALWNIRQRLNVGIGSSAIQVQLTGEHYCNQLDASRRQHVWIADAILFSSVGKWRFSTSIRNLFNQKTYRYTYYSDVQQSVSYISMRPREFLASAQYQF